MKKFLLKSWNPLKLVIVAIPVVLFVALFLRYSAFFGQLTIHYDFSHDKRSVGEWEPAGRALQREQNLQNGDTYQEIVGEPVYLPVTVPRSFDSVDVTIEYQNEDQPFVEFGVVTNEDPYAVRLQPLEQQVIDEALQDWTVMEDGTGTILLQRDVVFDDIDSFVENPPQTDRVATYGIDLPVTYIDRSYVPSPGGIVIDRVLRGPHDFYTYIKNEALHIEFDVVDMNRQFNVDEVVVEVYNSEDVLIHEEHIADDGVDVASGESADRGTVVIDLSDLQEGVYRVRFASTSDAAITQIRSEQEKFVAERSLFVINNEEYADVFNDLDLEGTTVYTNGTELLMRAERPEGVQMVLVDGLPVEIAEPANPYWYIPVDSGDDTRIREVEMPVNALVFDTNGYIAFDEESFFDPDYRIGALTSATAIADLDYLYVEGYVPPVENRLTKTQTVTVDLDGVAGDRKDLQFVLSAPGLEREGYRLRVDDVTLRFKRDPLYKRFLK